MAYLVIAEKNIKMPQQSRVRQLSPTRSSLLDIRDYQPCGIPTTHISLRRSHRSMLRSQLLRSFDSPIYMLDSSYAPADVD
jgi:hypothetical protein